MGIWFYWTTNHRTHHITHSLSMFLISLISTLKKKTDTTRHTSHTTRTPHAYISWRVCVCVCLVWGIRHHPPLAAHSNTRIKHLNYIEPPRDTFSIVYIRFGVEHTLSVGKTALEREWNDRGRGLEGGHRSWWRSTMWCWACVCVEFKTAMDLNDIRGWWKRTFFFSREHRQKDDTRRSLYLEYIEMKLLICCTASEYMWCIFSSI